MALTVSYDGDIDELGLFDTLKYLRRGVAGQGSAGVRTQTVTARVTSVMRILLMLLVLFVPLVA